MVDSFDMREYLAPKRLTMAMWDMAYVLRHGAGGSYADYNRVLDETVERGYNTVRIDPMPQWIDLQRPDKVLHWPDPHWPFMPWLWNTVVTAPDRCVDHRLHGMPPSAAIAPLHDERLVVGCRPDRPYASAPAVAATGNVA